MPEGPEIRIAADRIATAIVGHTARRVWFAFDRLKPWEGELTGRAVEAVEPRGKALLIRFRGGPVIYSHNQLYGRWYIRPAGELPRTGRSLRLAIENDVHSALLYSASEIDVLGEDELATHPFLARIGPDVLDAKLRPATIARRLDAKAFRGRQLGALLLDQGFLAGIGNYLRSEMLWVARLDPLRRARDLSAEDRRRLARAIRVVARRAYRQRGITVDSRLAATRRRKGVHRRDVRHYVFARVGLPCEACGGRIERIDVGGRRCYVCSRCQV